MFRFVFRQILQHAVIPPGGQAGVLSAQDLGINPGAVVGNRGGMQLVQQRQFEAVGHITFAFELAQKLLDRVAGGDDDDDGLHVASSMGHALDAPDNLRDGHR